MEFGENIREFQEALDIVNSEEANPFATIGSVLKEYPESLRDAQERLRIAYRKAVESDALPELERELSAIQNEVNQLTSALPALRIAANRRVSEAVPSLSGD